jgi:hypothetical protein
MSVRAKFRVHSVLDFGQSKEITMGPVYEGELGANEENKRFSRATPNGSFKMTVDNPYAADQFKPGQEWYFDLTLSKDV